MRSTEGEWNVGWYWLFKLVAKIQRVTVWLRMYKFTFWLTGWAMYFLDRADGGYPEFNEEDWDE